MCIQNNPLDLKIINFKNHIYKLKITLYELKQTLRSYYNRLNNFLLENDFTKGKIDSTLFIKRVEKHIILVQIYVNDIIFGSTINFLYKGSVNIMQMMM